MKKKIDECLIVLSKRKRAVVIIVVTIGPLASSRGRRPRCRGAEALVRCGVLSVVEYEVLLQGFVVLCSGLHSIVMLLYSTSAVQCIYSQYLSPSLTQKQHNSAIATTSNPLYLVYIIYYSYYILVY